MWREASLCQICKEPVWNFLCAECLRKDIAKWLPKKLSSEFDGFHKNFSYFFPLTGGYCVKCRNSLHNPVCPYCYTTEVYKWLREKNIILAETFIRIFFFDFENTGHETSPYVLPVTQERPEKRISGTCDLCESYSEELEFSEGLWICVSCREK